LYRVVGLSWSPFNDLGCYSYFRLVKSMSLLSGFSLNTFSIFLMLTIIQLRPTRCGTPVPQPLAVINSVKAKDRKRFVAGKGVSGV